MMPCARLSGGKVTKSMTKLIFLYCPLFHLWHLSKEIPACRFFHLLGSRESRQPMAAASDAFEDHYLFPIALRMFTLQVHFVLSECCNIALRNFPRQKVKFVRAHTFEFLSLVIFVHRLGVNSPNPGRLSTARKREAFGPRTCSAHHLPASAKPHHRSFPPFWIASHSRPQNGSTQRGSRT